MNKLKKTIVPKVAKENILSDLEQLKVLGGEFQVENSLDFSNCTKICPPSQYTQRSCNPIV